MQVKLHFIAKFLFALHFECAVAAVGLAFAFANVIGCQMNGQYYILLFLSVLIVYLVDHLHDVATHNIALRSRHDIYTKYKFYWTSIGLLLSTAIASIAFIYMELKLIVFGLLLGGVCAIYVLYKHKLQHIGIEKELFASLIFTSGVCIYPMACCEKWNTVGFFYLVKFFFCILLNLLFFSIMSFEEDIASGFGSFTLKYGVKRVQNVAFALIIMLVGATFGCFIWGQSPSPMVDAALLMIGFVYFIGVKCYLMIKNNTFYRIMADLVLALPCIFFL